MGTARGQSSRGQQLGLRNKTLYSRITSPCPRVFIRPGGLDVWTHVNTACRVPKVSRMLSILMRSSSCHNCDPKEITNCLELAQIIIEIMNFKGNMVLNLRKRFQSDPQSVLWPQVRPALSCPPGTLDLPASAESTPFSLRPFPEACLNRNWQRRNSPPVFQDPGTRHTHIHTHARQP